MSPTKREDAKVREGIHKNKIWHLQMKTYFFNA